MFTLLPQNRCFRFSFFIVWLIKLLFCLFPVGKTNRFSTENRFGKLISEVLLKLLLFIFGYSSLICFFAARDESNFFSRFPDKPYGSGENWFVLFFYNFRMFTHKSKKKDIQKQIKLELVLIVFCWCLWWFMLFSPSGTVIKRNILMFFLCSIYGELCMLETSIKWGVYRIIHTSNWPYVLLI